MAEVLARPEVCAEIGRAAETLLRHIPPGAAMIFEVREGTLVASPHAPIGPATTDVLVVTHPAQLGYGVLNGSPGAPRIAPERKGA